MATDSKTGAKYIDKDPPMESSSNLTSRILDYLAYLKEQLNFIFNNYGRRLVNADGDINELTRTAEETTSRLSDAEGNISTLQQTAEGLTFDVYNESGSVNTSISAVAGKVAIVVDSNNNIKAAEIVAAVNDAGSSVVISADHVNLSGYVTFTNLSTSGQTAIDGGNITTGYISADRIDTGTITLAKLATDAKDAINTAQTTANGANSQEQLIYISKATGTTSVSKTTTWITNDDGAQNKWGIKRPVYNSSYPVLFVATQRKTVGGTVTCTTPMIDATTTVIDGGHITTGTIDASQVNVTNLNADNITAGTLADQAGKFSLNLTTGALSAEALNVIVENTPVVNLLPSVYFREASDGTSWTSHGITFTVNADGSVTASGISDSDSTYYSIANSSFTALVPPLKIDPTKKYTISGVPQVTGCRLYFEKYNASKTYMTTGYLESAASTTISVGATYLVIYLRIMSGTDLTTPVTFYPMLEAGTTANAYVSSHNGAYAMESQIQQNASNISLKVSTSDYTGQKIIGLINLDATSATIAAQHIDLQGAVTISSLDAATKAVLLTGTAVKNQYYMSTSSSSPTGDPNDWQDTMSSWTSGKYVWTRVVTTKTYAGGTSTTTNGTAVYDANLTSALETGAANTANMPIVNLLPSVYYREYASGKTYGNSGITWTVNDDGSITATGTATANADYYLTRTSDVDVPRLIVDPTKKYTISGVPNVSGTQMRLAVYNSSGTLVDTLVIGYGTAPGVSRTIAAGYYKYVPYLRVTNGTALPTGGVTFYPMIEVGDTVHPYVSTHNGSGAIMAKTIASTVSCYYRSTTSATPTISTSTTIGTSASTDNAWEYVMPYPKNGCYFFTCEQYTHSDGSVTFSTVRSLSNADYTSKWCSATDSTYIDGGQIYTGTVNANAIKANATFTQKLYAQDFNITGGSVNITTSSELSDEITLSYGTASATFSPRIIRTRTGVFNSYASLDGFGGIQVGTWDGSTTYDYSVYATRLGTLTLGSATDAGNSGILTIQVGSQVARAKLTENELAFRDASSNVTATYPATGFAATNLKHSVTSTLSANGSKTITFSGQTVAMVFVTSGYQQGYATYVYNGYGNSDLRQHVAVLNTGTSISYVINSNQSITISSTVAANLTVVVLYGSSTPTLS